MWKAKATMIKKSKRIDEKKNFLPVYMIPFVSQIVRSHFIRATQTREPLLPHLSYTVEKDLLMCEYGS